MLSPDGRAFEVAQRIERYLDCGVTIAAVVDPAAQTVSVHRRLAPPLTLAGADALLEFDDAVPGFRCTLAQVFP